MPETYEVLAVKYARHDNRTRIDNFMLPDDHANLEPIDYFIWVIRNSNRTIIVDTGMDRAEAEGRGRKFIQKPIEALTQIGIDAHAVDNVIVTHMHYDHAGTLDDFPSARFHLQSPKWFSRPAFACATKLCGVPTMSSMSAAWSAASFLAVCSFMTVMAKSLPVSLYTGRADTRSACNACA